MTKWATKLVVFDLDGTLVDSAQDLTDSANQLIVELGGMPLERDRIVRMVGEGARVLVMRVLTAAGVTFSDAHLKRYLEIYSSRLLRHTKPYQGIPETLRALEARDIQQAVLTNKPLAPTKAIVDGLGLSVFFGDAIVAGDGKWGRKPEPEGLLSLVTRAGVERNEALLVGDSKIDLETAQAAGVAMCLARYGFSAADFPARDPSGVAFSIYRPLELLGRVEPSAAS